MRATAVTREQMEANHAAFAQVNRVAGLFPQEPATANREAVEQLSLAGGRLIPYRGHLYLARPIPYLVGLEHQRILVELDAAGNGGAADVAALVAANLRLFHRYLRSVRGWGALPWWCRRNPFRAATVREMGELNALFLIARMT